MQRRYIHALLALLAVALVARFALGPPESDGLSTEIAAYSQLRGLIGGIYVEDVDQKDLFYGAMKGMTGRLDAHTEFLTPDEYRQIRDDTEGEFGGLGVEVYQGPHGRLVVRTPLVGTPAAKAGLRPGDVIMRILKQSADGSTEWVETNTLSQHEAVRLIKGKPGTTVTIEVQAPGDEAPRQVTIERARIEVPSVLFSMILDRPGDVGYIDLETFQATSDVELDEAIKGLRSKGMKALVLDLRQNRGGSFESSVGVSNLFLKEGVIVSTRWRDESKNEIRRATAEGTYPPFPIVVLIERATASASEIVAAALRDNGRAKLVGGRSYGKGSVQSIVRFDLGEEYGLAGLKITCARYYTPKGVCINREPYHTKDDQWGVTPDVAVELTEEEFVKLWDRRSKAWVAQNSGGGEALDGFPDDKQLDAAYRLVMEAMGMSADPPAPADDDGGAGGDAE